MVGRKGYKQSQHVRCIRTKKGVKRKLINPGFKKCFKKKKKLVKKRMSGFRESSEFLPQVYVPNEDKGGAGSEKEKPTYSFLNMEHFINRAEPLSVHKLFSQREPGKRPKLDYDHLALIEDTLKDVRFGGSARFKGDEILPELGMFIIHMARKEGAIPKGEEQKFNKTFKSWAYNKAVREKQRDYYASKGLNIPESLGGEAPSKMRVHFLNQFRAFEKDRLFDKTERGVGGHISEEELKNNFDNVLRDASIRAQIDLGNKINEEGLVNFMSPMAKNRLINRIKNKQFMNTVVSVTPKPNVSRVYDIDLD